MPSSSSSSWLELLGFAKWFSWLRLIYVLHKQALINALLTCIVCARDAQSLNVNS